LGWREFPAGRFCKAPPISGTVDGPPVIVGAIAPINLLEWFPIDPCQRCQSLIVGGLRREAQDIAKVEDHRVDFCGHLFLQETG
jgi:hypothetical protein